ncbi:MAG: 8-oxo-dGTP diphosphatase, partial [Akkermansiaceae bacterium]
KKVAKLDILTETNEVEQDVARRAARLYRFDRSRYQKLEKQGINFEL